MRADANAEEGPDDDAAEIVEPEDEPSVLPGSESDEDMPPDTGFWINPAFVQLATGLDESTRRLVDPIGSKLAKTVDSIAREAWQQSGAAKALREHAALQMSGAVTQALQSLNAPVVAAFESAAANLVAANFRGLDQLTIASARYDEYATTALLAKEAFGLTALTNWRVSLQADSQIEQIVKFAKDLELPYSLLSNELFRISQSQIGLTDWIVQQDATNRLLGELSGEPLARWRDYIGGLNPEASLRDLRVSVLSGSAGLGIISADVLTSDVEDADILEASATRIEVDVLQPWEERRIKLGRDLRERLRAIDPSVPDLLAGAWDELERNGPAAVEKASHCIVEVLDRTLRAAAPDAAVREWHTRSGRPQSEWEDRGRPPHSLRIKYVAQRLGGERTVVVAQFESLAGLHKILRERLQAGKHASRGDLITVRNLLLGTEDLLTLLFLSDD